MKRRTAEKSPSGKAPTGRTSYTSKYALSERLFCGECGTRYRRCSWNIRGKKKAVWRCVSRLDYGTKYCKESPTMDEQPLQQAIMDAINSVMSPKEEIIQEIAETALLQFRPQGERSLEEIKNRIEKLNAEFEMLFEQTDTGEELEQRFAEINRALAALKGQQEKIAAKLRNNQDAQSKVRIMTDVAIQMEHLLTQWDEEIIRQLVFNRT